MTDFLQLDPVLQESMIGAKVTSFEYLNGEIRIGFDNGALTVGQANNPAFYMLPPITTREASVHA